MQLKVTAEKGGKEKRNRKALRVCHRSGVSPDMRASTEPGRFRTKPSRNGTCEGESGFQTKEQSMACVVLAAVFSTEWK